MPFRRQSNVLVEDVAKMLFCIGNPLDILRYVRFLRRGISIKCLDSDRSENFDVGVGVPKLNGDIDESDLTVQPNVFIEMTVPPLPFYQEVAELIRMPSTPRPAGFGPR